MWHAIYNASAIVVATFLTGIAIKVMDDLLDQEIDIAGGHINIANILGSGVAAYAMAALVAAVVLQPEAAVSLFCAAYALGMGKDLSFTYPSGVKGWVEALVVILFSLVITGVLVTASALLLMLSIQIFDNVTDKEPGEWPIGVILGKTAGSAPALVCAVVIFGIAASIYPLLALSVLINYILFFAFERWYLPCI